MSLLSEVIGVGSVLVVGEHVLAFDLSLIGSVVQEHLIDFLNVVVGQGRADAAVVRHVESLVRVRRRCGDLSGFGIGYCPF